MLINQEETTDPPVDDLIISRYAYSQDGKKQKMHPNYSFFGVVLSLNQHVETDCLVRDRLPGFLAH